MKKLAALFLALILLGLGIPSVFAAPEDDRTGPDPEDALTEGLDPEAGLSEDEIAQIGPYDPQARPELIHSVWDLLRGTLSDLDLLGLRSGIKVMGLLICTVLLTGLMEAGEGPGRYASAVGCVLILGAGAENLRAMIRLGTETVTRIHSYFRLLLPGMAGLMYASGGVTASASLTSGTLLVFDLLLAGLSGLVVPLLYLQIGLSGAESVLGMGNLDKLRDFVKWAASALVKGGLYVFSACLAGTGLFTGAVDAHKLKAVRMAISGMVPVVGGLVSDASQSLLAAAGILRTSVGLYGLLAVLAICLGPFLQIWLQYVLLKLTVAVCGLLGSNRQVKLIESLTEVMGMVLAATGISCILALLAVTLCVRAAAG